MQLGATHGVVLAGGAGRRIGGDKAFVELAGRPLLAHAVARLSGQVAQVAINAAPDARLVSFGVPVLADPMPGAGPLSGVLAALDWAASSGAARVATLPVDTPFVPGDLVVMLAAQDAPVVMAETADGLHPAAAVWSVAVATELRRALEAGVRKMTRVTEDLGAVTVRFDDADAFFNINAPKDLAVAEGRLR